MSVDHKRLNVAEFNERMSAFVHTIDNEATEAIELLEQTGRTLSESDIWTGEYAVQFSAEWQKVRPALEGGQKVLASMQHLAARYAQEFAQAAGAEINPTLATRI